MGGKVLIECAIIALVLSANSKWHRSPVMKAVTLTLARNAILKKLVVLRKFKSINQLKKFKLKNQLEKFKSKNQR